MLRTLRRSLALAAFSWVVALSAPPASAQNQLWIHQLGTSPSDFVTAAAPDAFGGVYVVGDTFGSLGGPSAGGFDAWFANYDSAGNQTWIRQFGTSQDDWANTAAAGWGGVYLGGSTDGSFGGPNAGNADAWIAHYNSSGNPLWIRQIGSSANDYLNASSPDGSGGVYVGGSTGGDLGGPNAGNDDAWLARYDGAGTQLWILHIGSSALDDLRASAPDTLGGVYVTGLTNGSLGGPNAGYDDAWLAHYDGAGNQTWIRQFGSSQNDWANAAAPDGSGGVYVSGTTDGSLGGPNAGGHDVWLAHYDAAGNQIWIRQLGTSQDDWAYAAPMDTGGGAYMVGYTLGSLGGPNAGGIDAWIGHFDGSGNQLWIRQIGSSADDDLHASAPDGSGGLYVGGRTTGSLGGPNAGTDDAWFARFGSNIRLLCEPGAGGVISCPCSNAPIGPGRGCDNSAGTGGATIHSLGADSLAGDTLEFVASGERPTALSLLLQGTAALSSGAVYGQGVRCVAGTLVRICNHNASAGSVTLPDFTAGDPTISARSAALGNPILAGQSRWYLVYYRDPLVLGGCPASSTFNSGPTMRADWGP